MKSMLKNPFCLSENIEYGLLQQIVIFLEKYNKPLNIDLSGI
jgi:hypothetical protein